MNPVLSVRALGKAFLDGEVQRTVLADVNLDLGNGEVLALMGAERLGEVHSPEPAGRFARARIAVL